MKHSEQFKAILLKKKARNKRSKKKRQHFICFSIFNCYISAWLFGKLWRRKNNRASEKNCKARRSIIIKTCTHKRNVNSFKINFAPLLCVPFCRQRIQTISIVWGAEKVFKSSEKKISSCRLFAIQKEPENYFSSLCLYVSTSFWHLMYAMMPSCLSEHAWYLHEIQLFVLNEH